AGSRRSMTAIEGFLAGLRAEAGRSEEAVRTVEAAKLGLGDRAVDDDFWAVTTNAPWVWVVNGDYERGIAEADWAMALADRLGMAVGGGRWITAPKAEAQFRLGRWDDALETIESCGEYIAGRGPDVTHRYIEARIFALRADGDAARAAVDDA